MQAWRHVHRSELTRWYEEGHSEAAWPTASLPVRIEDSTSRADALQCLHKEQLKAELEGGAEEHDCSPSPTFTNSCAVKQVTPRLDINLSTIRFAKVSSLRRC